jgi:hypothetical protein
MRGEVGRVAGPCRVSANEYSCAHGTQVKGNILEEAQLTFAVVLFFSFFLPLSRFGTLGRLHLLQERRKTKSEIRKMFEKATGEGKKGRHYQSTCRTRSCFSHIRILIQLFFKPF